MKTPDINESFICKIWENNKYYSDLTTPNDDKVIILNYGKRNFDSGPDYLNAKIKINNKTLEGDIEIHRDFKGWIEHKHKGDANYNSVILQVVMWNKGLNVNPKVKRSREVNTVILSDFLKFPIDEIWQEIIAKPTLKFKLPCLEYNDLVPEIILKSYLSKLSMERLNLKSNRIEARISELIFEEKGETKGRNFIHKSKYWEQVFYEFFFEALGFSKNKEPMLKLTQIVKLEKISKFIKDFDKDKLFVIQTILYGNAGFLDEIKIKSRYPFELKNFWLNKIKYDFAKVLDKHNWKFFRLRPPNFPTVRLAYGSQIIHKVLFDDLFKNLVKTFSSENFNLSAIEKELNRFLLPIPDDFWNHNYRFGLKAPVKFKLVGRDRINDIITNVIIPIIYLYSRIFNDDIIKNNALKFYANHNIANSNSILKIMEQQLLKSKNISINTPAIEQAVIQLYNFYCTRGRCDDCKIKMDFINDKGFDYKIIFY